MELLAEETLNSELQHSGAEFTPTALRLPDTTTMESWASIGRKLLRADQVMQWWIGDWAAFGETKFDKVREFCEANGFRAETVADHAWVSRSTHHSLRKESVPWSIYKELAPLKPKDQMKWLKRVELDSLSVSSLRKQIREDAGEESALNSEGQSAKLGSKMADDFAAWLKKQPDEFWTADRRGIWVERLGYFCAFREKLLEG